MIEIVVLAMVVAEVLRHNSKDNRKRRRRGKRSHDTYHVIPDKSNDDRLFDLHMRNQEIERRKAEQRGETWNGY